MQNSATQKHSKNRGMTLIELVVVIGIFATISGVVLFNFTGFTTSVSLGNLAQDIALRVKNAQTEAISGKFAPGFVAPLVPAYGVYFNTITRTGATSFKYFADLDNDGFLTGTICGAGEECLEQVGLETGDAIQQLCVNEESGFPNCGSPVNDLHITFKRPFPDAIIKSSNFSNQISDAEIKILSPKGMRMKIIVWPTGQVSVQSETPLSQ